MNDLAYPDFRRLGPPPGSHMVVAGGCGGIGRGVVRAALESDLRVTVLDLAASQARHPVPTGVDFHAIDAFDPASVDAAFAAVGSFDVLVMLVGFNHALVPTEERSIDSWDEVVAGNLRAAFLICRAAVPRLCDGGAIVNMASGLATRVMAGYGPYSASKAGVIALTKALAVENAPRLRANAIAPSAIDTAFLAGGTGRVDNENWQRDFSQYLQTIPLRRLGEVEDVVGPILFLAGPAARYMTGQVLYVNGGGLTP